MDRGWPAFPRAELSGEDWTDSLASIRPVGNTVSRPFDSGIDWLWSASFLIVRSLISKGLNLAEPDSEPLPERCSDHASINNPSRQQRLVSLLACLVLLFEHRCDFSKEGLNALSVFS